MKPHLNFLSSLQACATTLARLVLPHPGGPHSTRLGMSPVASMDLRADLWPVTWSCPRRSPRARGRICSARGTCREGSNSGEEEGEEVEMEGGGSALPLGVVDSLLVLLLLVPSSPCPPASCSRSLFALWGVSFPVHPEACVCRTEAGKGWKQSGHSRDEEPDNDIMDKEDEDEDVDRRRTGTEAGGHTPHTRSHALGLRRLLANAYKTASTQKCLKTFRF